MNREEWGTFDHGAPLICPNLAIFYNSSGIPLCPLLTILLFFHFVSLFSNENGKFILVLICNPFYFLL